MKRERERDYNGKIKSLIPKHFLGFSGQSDKIPCSVVAISYQNIPGRQSFNIQVTFLDCHPHLE